MMGKSMDIESLKKSWKAPFVLRDQRILDQFSGGLLNARTLANHDSKGTGPKGRFRVGNRIAYPIAALIEWLEERTRDAK